MMRKEKKLTSEGESKLLTGSEDAGIFEFAKEYNDQTGTSSTN